MTFAEDQVVRIKKTGVVVRLDDINPNPNYLADDEVWASAWGASGTVSIGSPDDIEPFEPVNLDSLSIATEISGSLHSGFGDTLSVHETSVDGGHVYVQATYRGLPISFTVTVSDVESEV